MLLMMDGRPLAWDGPFEGRMHDSECFANSDVHVFSHKKGEIMADKAYRNVRHCFCQEMGDTVDDQFDMELNGSILKRVQQFFAHIDKHKLFHYNQHEVDFVKSAFRILWNAERIDWELHKSQLCSDSVEVLSAIAPIVLEWKSSGL